MTPGHHDVGGNDEVWDDVVRARDRDGDVPDVAPVGVQEGGGPPVLGLVHGAVLVPGLGPVPGEEETDQQGPHPVSESVTLTVRHYQSHPAQRPETDIPSSLLNGRITQ